MLPAALSILTIAAGLLGSCAEASKLKPPVLPLFVRTPYFNAHLQNAREEPWTKWPMFWTGEPIGLAIIAVARNTTTAYPLLGRSQDFLDGSGDDGYNVTFPTYTGAQYDASTTNLTYHIPGSSNTTEEPIELTLSFLSPITPTSTLRQAIPAAYLSVHVVGSYDLDVYIDVNGEWVSGDHEAELEWEFWPAEDKKSLKTWKLNRENELLYTERNDKAEWGHLLFSAPSDVHHQSGEAKKLRPAFARNGTLANKVDDKFRPVMRKEPVFAFAKHFKLASNSSSEAREESVQFTIAHIQDPVVQYAAARGLTHMKPLWQSWFTSDKALVEFHYNDYKHASALAGNYSAQLAKDAYQSGADDYVDIVALSARQVMGATSFSGTPDNPLLFLKEISSNGNTQTVDVIFPSFPFFLYTNPRWLAYLLEPLLEHQLSGQYPNKYSMHDLGAHFPNETGHADGRDEYMPVEECGDMLIMGLALVNSLTYADHTDSPSVWSTIGAQSFDQASESPFAITSLGSHEGIEHIDDTWGGGVKGASQAQKWLEKSYRIWEQWTGYLVEFSLRPHNQLSTDDFAGWLPLQTNLALKGIIGIKAMSELASVLGKHSDAKKYGNISEVYIEKWQEYGISRDDTHAKLAYDWYGSWTTLYSLYADAVLCFHPSLTNSTTSSGEMDDFRLTKRGQEVLTSGGSQKPLHPPKHRHDGRQPITKDFIPSRIYKMQSDWYSAVMQKYGLPLDSRHLYTKSDWEFEAAAVASKSVRSGILERVALWLNETVTDRPFTDLYNSEEDGGFPGPNFFARPVVGGHFAFLTLERACKGVYADVAEDWRVDERQDL